MADLSEIDLAGQITDRLNSPADGKITVLSYVDGEGQPHTSVRASIHAHSRDQLGLWVRHGYVGTMTRKDTPPEGGFLGAISTNPRVSVLYRQGLTTYVFTGRARVETDPSIRDAMFDLLPPGEQFHNTETGPRTGEAVIIDLDHVVGGTLSGEGAMLHHVEMARS